MTETSAPEQLTLGADIRSFSCFPCRQRKVRCDRRHPCSPCARMGKECSFVAPLRGKRRGKRAPKEGLHAKLQRYEELLKSYGVKIELTNDADISDAESGSEQAVAVTDHTEPRMKASSEPFPNSRLVAKDGTSRYFDNGIWSNLGDEFHRSEARAESDCQTLAHSDNVSDEHALVLGYDFIPGELSNLHPSFPTIRKLWEIFVDRVDPLIKILHLPTFWPMLVNALQNPKETPKCLQALMFTFYYTATSALNADECQAILGERLEIISARYKRTAHHALINAGFLNTTNLMTLQAFVMFVVGAKGHYHIDSLFMLSGVAVRLARRMGLHRDGASLGLSPFESEIRKRLWWQIFHIDMRASEFCGSIPSKDLFATDVKIPLNVEDEDLHPDMKNLPPERTGITSMVLCLLRCYCAEFHRGMVSSLSLDRNYEILDSSTMSLAEKDHRITQMEDYMERKYLRYCDPSNTLHCFASVIARSAICKMKLLAHNPRQLVKRGAKLTQKDRDIIFSNGIKLLEYGNLLQSTPGLRKYMWQIRSGFLWDTLVYILIETRHRKIGAEVDRAWQLIGGIFSHYPQIFAEASDSLEVAIGNWTLQVWDDCSVERKAQGLPELQTPEYINSFRQSRKSTANSSSKPKEWANMANYPNEQSLGQAEYPSFVGLESYDSYDISNLLSYDLEPNDWLQWERLFGTQEVQAGATY